MQDPSSPSNTPARTRPTLTITPFRNTLFNNLRIPAPRTPRMPRTNMGINNNMFMFHTPLLSRSNTQPGTPRMSMNIPKSTVPSVANMRSALPSSEINKSSRMRAKSEHGIKEKAVEAEAEAEAKAKIESNAVAEAEAKAKANAKAKAMAEADTAARAAAKAKAKAAAKAVEIAKTQRAKEEAAAARARIPSWERSKYDDEQTGTSETPYGV